MTLFAQGLEAQCVPADQYNSQPKIIYRDGFATQACNNKYFNTIRYTPTFEDEECMGGQVVQYVIEYAPFDFRYVQASSSTVPLTVVENIISPTLHTVTITHTVPTNPYTAEDYYAIIDVDFKVKSFGNVSVDFYVEESFDGGPLQNGVVLDVLLPDVLILKDADIFEQGELLSENPNVNTVGSLPWYIKGNMIFDISETLNTNATFPKTIFLESDAKITIPGNISADLRNIDFVVCEDRMWNGIVLEDDATLNMSASHIKDAEYAVLAEDNATLVLTGNTFDQNLNSLHLDANSAGSNVTVSAFANNVFTSTAPLKPRPSGVPSPVKPSKHIFVEGYPTLDLTTSASTRNQFTLAGKGIRSSNTNLIINNADFTVSNSGIEVSGGGNVSAIHDCTFAGSTYGVRVNTHSLSSKGNTFTNVGEGYRLLGVGSRNVLIEGNDINATSKGIFDFFSEGAQYADNTISITNNNPNAVGVDLLFVNNAEVFQNILNLGGIHAGVSLSSSNLNVTRENDFNLLNGAFGTRGVDLMDGVNNQISCNAMLGTSSTYTDSHGIFSEGSGMTDIACNSFSTLETAVGFLGGNNDNNVKGNTFFEHGTALEVGDPDFFQNSFIGQQAHHGNRWIGSAIIDARNHATNAQVINASRFIVDGSDPTFGSQYLPSVIFPQTDWFENDASLPSFLCTNSQYTCDGSPGTGIVPQVPSDTYVNWVGTLAPSGPLTVKEQWVTKNQLSNQIKTFTAATDYTPAINTFLSNTNNAVQGEFADVQNEILTAMGADTDLASATEAITIEIEKYIQTGNTSNLAASEALLSALDSDNTTNANFITTTLAHATTMLNAIALPAGDDVAADYHTAYTILINYLSNDYTLTNREIQNAEGIANKCQAEYGKAVAICRAMLREVKGTIYDNAACSITIPRASENMYTPDEQVAELKFYPNPVQSVITFDKVYESVQIRTMDGKIVRSQSSSTNQMGLEALPRGMYIISARSAGESYTAKMIKN